MNTEKPDLGTIITDIERAAAAANVDLCDPAYPYTAWLKNGSEPDAWFFREKSRSRQHANVQAIQGGLGLILRGVEGDKVLIAMWKDNKWVENYLPAKTSDSLSS
jgi:hypothetical protein